MSFWELFTALASAASIVSFAIAISGVFNGRATRRVVREMTGDTQNLIRSGQEDTRALLRETQNLIQSNQADTRALLQEMQSEARALFERMDQRADERHREVIEAIRTLRA